MQTPVLAHGVRKPSWRAMFCGAAIRRIRSSASSRFATILLLPATSTTLRGPKATGAMRFPTMSSQWSVPSIVTALIPVMKRSDRRALRRISSRSGRGIEASNPSSSVQRGSLRSHSMIPVARIVIESPNDTSCGISASTTSRIRSNASFSSRTTVTSNPWRRSVEAHASSRSACVIVFVACFVSMLSSCLFSFDIRWPTEDRPVLGGVVSRRRDFPPRANPPECRARPHFLRR